MKILMILTSHDQLGTTGRKTGFWIVTGQNPASSTPAAYLLLSVLTQRAAA